MKAQIQLKLFATLSRFSPPDADHYAVEAGLRILDLVRRLNIPEHQARLVFINGRKGSLESIIQGGERVGIFPPVGGG